MQTTKPKLIFSALILIFFVITGLLAIQNPAAAGIISIRYKEYKAKYKHKEDKQNYFKMKALKKDHSQSFFFWKNLCETRKNDTDAQFAKLTPKTQAMCQQYYSYHGYKKYVYYRDKHQDNNNSDNNNNNNNEEFASFVCGTNTVADADGNEYETVSINDQCWMASNLMTTKYPDGSSITRGPVDASWDENDNRYYAYPPNATNDAEETLVNIQNDKLGFVYQWSAAMNGSATEGAQGICPTSWHVPTDSQQYALENYLKDIGETCDANREGWDCATAGTRLQSGGTSGMDFPLTGSRDMDGSFYDRASNADLWSSSKSEASAWFRVLYSGNATVGRGTDADAKARGFSVRCLKD